MPGDRPLSSPRAGYQHVRDDAPTPEERKSPEATVTELAGSRGITPSDSPWQGSDTAAYQSYSNAYASGNTTPGGLGTSPTHAHVEGDGTCQARDGYRKHHGTWASVSILLLATYATIFSGIWVGLALAKVKWSFIGTKGGTSQGVASTIIAAFAKSIELAFVTVFVAFLGQYLSREALSSHSKGITLAQMNLRSWMLQPGLIVQSLHSFTYAARTWLGAYAMTAATMALLYTTASDAQVSPKPLLSSPRQIGIEGRVSTDFANATYLNNLCPTPIPKEEDPLYYSSTCSAIEHSGQAFHNYLQYLGDWVTLNQRDVKMDLTKLQSRPSPVGMLFDNTTAVGSWLYADDIPLVKKDKDRIVNNVTMAMPHSGVYNVAMETLNGLTTKAVANAQTQLSMKAQVVSPAINVLCAEMTKDELKPLIFREWPEFKGNATVPGGFEANYTMQIPPDWRNETAVDDLFQFSDSRIPPVFPRYPLMFNTIMNYTSVWGVDTVYLLIAANNTGDTMFNMCSMSMSTEAGCTTDLKIEVQGGQVTTNCADSNDLAFSSSAPRGHRNNNWPFVAQAWGTSLSLGAGISDGNASNARLLSQLVPKSDTADKTRPTISEALAVLAGCTLIVSGLDAPFNQDWVMTPSAMPDDLFFNPQKQEFQATIRVAGFQSGATTAWQQCFSVVLIAVFLMSAFCLIYFIHTIRVGGLVNDFMEFQNMFALALHSPADRRLAGTAAGGPEKYHMREPWYIKEDWNHQVFIGDGARRRGHTSWMSHAVTSPRNLQKPLPSPLHDIEFDNMETKPPETYKPGIKDGLKRKLGGLGLGLKK